MSKSTFLVIAAACLVAGCASSDERQWMKIKTSYTTDEFRRDLAECSKSGKLNDECMQARGWVALTPKSDKPREFDPRDKDYRNYGTPTR